LNHEQYVKTDPANFRHEGKVPLVGNAGKARQVLGWQPTVPFRGLVRMMVDADLKTAHTLANE
jgi:GDPmannose 4,6-dehydratase